MPAELPVMQPAHSTAKTDGRLNSRLFPSVSILFQPHVEVFQFARSTYWPTNRLENRTDVNCGDASSSAITSEASSFNRNDRLRKHVLIGCLPFTSCLVQRLHVEI